MNYYMYVVLRKFRSAFREASKQVVECGVLSLMRVRRNVEASRHYSESQTATRGRFETSLCGMCNVHFFIFVFEHAGFRVLQKQASIRPSQRRLVTK